MNYRCQQTSINKKGLEEVKHYTSPGVTGERRSQTQLQTTWADPKSWAIGIAEKFPAMVRSTTRNEMSKAFKKYVTGIRRTYPGNKQKADEAMSSFTMNVK